MMFSWPSRASTAAYTVDEAVVGISGRRMAEFLDTVVARSAPRVHLIAHSMGYRTLIEALQATWPGAAAPAEARFGQVVLTAPMWTATTSSMRSSSLPAADRITLYASDNDLALRTSQKIAWCRARRPGGAADHHAARHGYDRHVRQ